MKEIDFDFINKKLSSGLKLRIDVGLSTSMPHSMEWMQQNEDIFVIGFEPHPISFKSSQKFLNESNFKDRCYLIEAAVDNVDFPSKSVFYALDGPEADYNVGTSSLKKPTGWLKNSVDQIYNVDVLSLKYILNNIDYDVIDYLKTDTQGNDLNVIKSVGEHIKNVLRIQSEYDSSGLYEFANTGQELDNFLFENGFEKTEPVLCYYYDNDSGNMMYDVADYIYKNTSYVTQPYVNGKEILIASQSREQHSSTWLRDGHIADIDLIEKFVSCIEEDFTILDIGTQSGSFSLAAKFYPNTTWHSFEPDYWARILLNENIKLNCIRNITVHEEALTNSIGDSILTIYHYNRGFNTLGKNIIRFDKNDSFEFPVKTNTIDNLFLNTKIDLIKIDTEGSEYDILTGGIETIKKYKPKILMEYEERNLNQCNYTIHNINELIEQINYEITWMSESGRDVLIEPKQS